MLQLSDDSEEDIEPFTPPTTFEDWLDVYYEAVEDLYSAFLREGRAYFGEAFFQFGNIENFASTVYTRTSP